MELRITNLEMRASDRFRELLEQRYLDLGELGRVHDLEDVFHLVQVHNLLRTVGLGPIAQQTKDHLFQVRIAIEKARFGPSLTSSVKVESFSRNWTIQYANCG